MNQVKTRLKIGTKNLYTQMLKTMLEWGVLVAKHRNGRNKRRFL